MKHFHGTPLGGKRDAVARFIIAGNRYFLIPFGRDEDLPIVAESSCGFCADNRAFSAWKSGEPITDWQPYYRWCKEICLNPRFEFAIIPDVIDGDELENKKLFAAWFSQCKLADGGWVRGAPVWHMHESFAYLKYLMQHSEILCIGSSGQYATPGTTEWHDRMAKAMDILCDDKGRPKRRIHGLRMLAPEIVERYPFYSADSTNIAQNSELVKRYGMYKPPTQDQRREVLASRIESVRSPSVWQKREENALLFELEKS